MDVSSLLASFQTGTYTVTRTPIGTVQHGKEVVGTPTTLFIDATVYPATGMELLRLEEGRRSNETMTVITSTLLYVDGAESANEADIVTIGGTDWEVQNRETWTDPRSGSVAYRCIVQAVGV